jgi:hypothetical protein
MYKWLVAPYNSVTILKMMNTTMQSHATVTTVKPYLFNLQSLYRIWFSNDPNQFLGIENELRFIRMRRDNKSKDIYFIYSASALNPNALQRMQVFCNTHAIRPIDFDSEIMAMLEHEDDLEMYAIARAELTRALRKQHGNLAAAADSLRLIVPVIEKFGIYSDFDVELNFNKQPRTHIESDAPMLLNADIALQVVGQATANGFLTNSDFLAFACDREVPHKLANDAVQHLRGLQQRIINNYKNPFTMRTLFHVQELNAGILTAGMKFVFQQFSQLPDKKSVYQFRKFVMEFDYPGAPQDIIDTLQFKFLFWSVTRMSGPNIFWSSYMNFRPENDLFTFGSTPNNYAPYVKYHELIKHSCVNANKDIAACVQLKNTREGQEKFGNKQPEPGVLADLSWTATGAENKLQRANAVEGLARTTQFFARKKLKMMRGDINTDLVCRK